MALVVLALLIGLAIGVGGGGRIQHLTNLRVRRWGLGAAGLLLVVVPNPVSLGLGTAALAAFAASNLRNTGMGVVAIGLSLNALVVLTSSGMPVRASSLVAIGHADPEIVQYKDLGAKRHVEKPGDSFTALGDIVPIPPLGSVVSFGDLIIAVGLANVLKHLTRRRRAEAQTAVAPIDRELFADENLGALTAGMGVRRDVWDAVANDTNEFDFSAGQPEPIAFDDFQTGWQPTPAVAGPPRHRRSDSMVMKSDGPITPPWGVIKLAAQRMQRHQKAERPRSPARNPKVAMDIDEPWDSETLARLADSPDNIFRAGELTTPLATFVSFRLGGPDGVSVEAAKWRWALEELGFTTGTVTEVDLPGLGIEAPSPPSAAEVANALEGADLVVVENLLSLPLNPGAAAVVANALRGRSAVIHHHDLSWQHARFEGHPAPPDDRAWRHVTINELSRRQLRERGIDAVVVRNRFDADPPAGDRDGTRRMLDVGPDEVLLVQPTRAIPRKNIPQAIVLAEAVGATLWIVGPAEMGYGPELERLRSAASARVIHGPPQEDIAHAYAAGDVITFPSTWEGFGNPTIESALHRRALAIGDYPTAEELRHLGFRWLRASEPDDLRHWLADPDPALLDHNQAVAREHFNLEDLPAALAAVIP